VALLQQAQLAPPMVLPFVPAAVLASIWRLLPALLTVAAALVALLPQVNLVPSMVLQFALAAALAII
jgi:hypothetical protein